MTLIIQFKAGKNASNEVNNYDWTFQNERSNGRKVVAESQHGDANSFKSIKSWS